MINFVLLIKHNCLHMYTWSSLHNDSQWNSKLAGKKLVWEGPNLHMEILPVPFFFSLRKCFCCLFISCFYFPPSISSTVNLFLLNHQEEHSNKVPRFPSDSEGRKQTRLNYSLCYGTARSQNNDSWQLLVYGKSFPRWQDRSGAWRRPGGEAQDDSDSELELSHSGLIRFLLHRYF